MRLNAQSVVIYSVVIVSSNAKIVVPSTAFLMPTNVNIAKFLYVRHVGWNALNVERFAAKNA